MDKIVRLKTIDEYNRLLGARTQHPLVCVTDLSEVEAIPHVCKEFGFYCVYFKELDHVIDKHTKQIISSYIESMLNHCERFYDRQFITREVGNRSVLGRFERFIADYFHSDRPTS